MAATDASTPRVPAWKKLGLKLKYAKDEPQSPQGTPGHGSASRKRARPEAEGEDAERSQSPHKPHDPAADTPAKKKSKKSKLEQEPSATDADTSSAPASASKKEKKEKKEKKRDQKAKAAETLPDRTVGAEESAPPATPLKAPSLKRKKSVSFTPDTKKSDGDSAQQMFKAWASSQNESSADEPLIPTTESEPPQETAIPSTQGPSKQELKKAKKQQRKAAKATESTGEAKPLPPYLAYLSQYHDDKANWKFSKKLQIDLLNNLFNVYRVPSSYDSAVAAYIAGLQGGAARYRLQQQAKEALKETDDVPTSAEASTADEDMDDPAARKAAKDAVLRKQLKDSKKRRREAEQQEEELSEEFKQKLAKRRRAEEILRSLGDVALPPPKPAAEPLQKEEPVRLADTKKPARPRKQRSALPDDDDSSSSDSSSSDGDLSSSDESSSDESSDDESSVVSSSSSDTSSGSDSDSESSSEDDSSDGDSTDSD